MENNDLIKEPKVEEQVQQEEVNLGTFKSVKTLKEAYDSLRKTFTQNAMELAKYKKQAESLGDDVQKTETTKTENIDKNDEKTIKNDDFSQKNQENATNFDILESDKVTTTPDNQDDADKVNTPAEVNFESAEWQQKVQNFFRDNQEARDFAKEIGKEIIQDKAVRDSVDPLGRAWIKILQRQNVRRELSEQELQDLVTKNEAIKQKIIVDYLSQLQHKKTVPTLIANNTGAEVNAKVSPHALNMDEAKELARKIFLK